MTLDEAIEHAEQTARSCEGECSEDHRQLSEWLKELRRLRKIWNTVRADARAANLESEQLKSENASLRGAAMGLGELCDQLKEENAKLRELVRDLHKALFTLDIDHCQACQRDSINGPCTKFMVRGSDECSIEEDMRELGIEVDE